MIPLFWPSGFRMLKTYLLENLNKARSAWTRWAANQVARSACSTATDKAATRSAHWRQLLGVVAQKYPDPNPPWPIEFQKKGPIPGANLCTRVSCRTLHSPPDLFHVFDCTCATKPAVAGSPKTGFPWLCLRNLQRIMGNAFFMTTGGNFALCSV